MKEGDIEDISEIIKDTVISTIKTSSSIIDDEKIRLNEDSNEKEEKLMNTKEELSKLPKSIQNYLESNNLYILILKGIEPVQIIKAALLQKSDSFKVKDFTFQFSENQDYYFFITIEKNKNYLNPITSSVAAKKKKFSKDKKEPEGSEPNKIENKKINLNFDYNKYVIKAIVAKKKESGKLEIFCEKILNREICQVSHASPDSISYYKNTKVIKPEKAKKMFDYTFAILIPEKYYLLEIETKKPAADTLIKEDGIVSVLYLITPKKKQTIQLFTMVKYSIYFIYHTLCNYIGKYIHDMIYDFCHLPSECFDDFLSHIGSLTPTTQSNYKLEFPLKKYVKVMESLSHKNLINHMYRNLPNISRPKAADRVPFHKFIFMYEKYKLYYAEKEFKIKQKLLDEKKTKKYSFLKPSIIHDPTNDKITKEHKINLNVLIKSYFEILEKFLKDNLSKDKSVIQEFIIRNLCKFLTQYTSFKGFFNLDIVMNEDNVFEFQCTNNKACNKKINNNMFGCVVNSLGLINWFFGFNEGFFHKHFSIMDYSYNFNEKNVIHTFLCINDSSKKNKVRIYDIPFMDKWNYQIAGLLLTIYRDSFGFLSSYKNYEKKQKKEIDFHGNFAKLFQEVHNNIITDLFKYYENVIPDFYKFCTNISVSPLDKYNCLDNLCQNFTNNSIKMLIRNNIIFFSPFDVVYNINQDSLLNQPNLNSILEPYLILVDEKLKKYLDKKEKKDKYLEENKIEIKSYFNRLKYINIEKPHYSVFLTEKKSKEVDEEEEDDKEVNVTTGNTNSNISEENTEKEEEDKSEIQMKPQQTEFSLSDIYPKKMHFCHIKNVSLSKIPSKIFDFYFLFNLYYKFTYQTMKEMKTIFVNYDIIKRYIASIESSVTISFNDYDKTIIKTNEKGGLEVIKTTKKNTKKNIIKDLTIMRKLDRMTRHMNYIFAKYVNNVINDIINDGSSQIKIKNSQDENYYIKIGHYIVNFLAYEKDGVFFNTFDQFKADKNKFYERVQSENHILDAIKNYN